MSTDRDALAKVVRTHSVARAVLVDGAVRWVCEGCGQPLTPSNPAAAFSDLANHQADALLASPQFARLIAEAKAEALREATAFITDTTGIGKRDNAYADGWYHAIGHATEELQDRADALAAETPTESAEEAK